MSPEAKQQLVATFTVQGEDPREATAPIFSNFVGVSHLGNEVQFEFVFLDINMVAQLLEVKKSAEQAGHDAGDERAIIQGKTVAKIVIPASSFLQVKDHLIKLFERLEKKDKEEQPHERAGSGH